MANTETTSVYTFLEKLIRYLEKKGVDIKTINLIKERRSLDFMK